MAHNTVRGVLCSLLTIILMMVQEGGGISCVMEGGEVLERAGVNVTVMTAPLSPKLQESMRAR